MRGADALGAGLLLIPQGVGSLLSRIAATRLMDRLGVRATTLIGFALVGLATVPFALADADTATWWLLVSLFVRGLGMGLVLIPLMTVAFVGLERAEIPHASIVTRISQQLGGSVGVALLAVILSTSATATGQVTVAFDTAFWWAVGFTGLAVLLSLMLPGRITVEPPSPTDEPTPPYGDRERTVGALG